MFLNYGDEYGDIGKKIGADGLFIPMWYSLGYGVCPAIMRGVCMIIELIGKPVYGFYVSKVF